MQDTATNLSMSESGAIMEYLIHTYGEGRLYAKPGDENYFDFLHWWHWANATCQATMVCSMFVDVAAVPREHHIKHFADDRLEAKLKHIDHRLGESKWLSGREFSAADIMTVYSLTTQRYFGPLVDLGPYANVLRWLKDCSDRPAYQRAMARGDPEMQTLVGLEVPSDYMFALGGVESGHWKKG